MSPSPVRDFIVGIFVLLGLAAVGYLSFSVGGLSYAAPAGFTVYARFDETGGLKSRAPVEIAGVKVGRVTGIVLDENYRARVSMDLEPELKLPTDTTASIVTSGILGDRYITLQPGGEDQLLKNGDEIAFTESAIILERLIGKLVHGSVGDESNGNGGGDGSSPKPDAGAGAAADGAATSSGSQPEATPAAAGASTGTGSQPEAGAAAKSEGATSGGSAGRGGTAE
ncbi:MAG: phospholipid/cholesterol/gamma-HCH transport system substrate-binding protein [Candidatus Binatota bacterium]|jgi:phospholipid/cholesterol/gamma-HCH transport system substrate-binding protein|nr:phospholipid/cholesterol/gamma-HCH transport system substrate-binding protein [Candidatus Binatota bacterium]